MQIIREFQSKLFAMRDAFFSNGITLALEHIKEIDFGLSFGATKMDIIFQFLRGSILISFTRGMIGVILGISIAFGISELAEIPDIVNFSSIILSFGVAVIVVLIFGIAPAKRAAEQYLISFLRYA